MRNLLNIEAVTLLDLNLQPYTELLITTCLGKDKKGKPVDALSISIWLNNKTFDGLISTLVEMRGNVEKNVEPTINKLIESTTERVFKKLSEESES